LGPELSAHIEVDHSLTGEGVTRVLERLKTMGRLPAILQMGNGPEFITQVLDRWTYENGVKLHFIRPVKPMDNGYIESINGRVREECLPACLCFLGECPSGD
jgi:putative transposase